MTLTRQAAPHTGTTNLKGALGDTVPMKIQIGITLFPEKPPKFTEWVRCAEGSGFDILGLADSQSLYRELYVGMAQVAACTSTLKFGPRVTNPVTRHPAVTASAMASLEEMAPGRTLLGLGTGDSALSAIGLSGVRLIELQEYVEAVRGLMAGEQVTYQGKSMRLAWANARIPLYISAHGPKTLRLAGALADGVVVGTGFTPEVVRDTLAQIRHGAEEAGRSLDELDIWWWAHCNVAGSEAEALRDLRSPLAAAGNHLTRFTAEGKHIPPERLEAFRRLRREYQVESHFDTRSDSANTLLTEKLGLLDYLAKRFAIAGTPEQCVERIRDLAKLGVTNIWSAPSFTDKMGFMKSMEKHVFPHVK